MKKNTDIAVHLVGITKQYAIHHEKPTFVEKIIRREEEKFLALHDINLRINQGERIGIIGPNGSGKTTLLKIIAGITTPSSGSIQTYGKVVSLIDLEAGFHPDLTGVQNITLNGMILGMEKKEILRRMTTIKRLAGIGRFIDTPLFTFSQGMKLRLGFSIAVNSNPDILLLDENFAVGDQEFQKNAKAILQRYIRQNKTLIFASHWLQFLKLYCNRLLIVDHGSILDDGKPSAMIKKYQHIAKYSEL